MMARKFPSIRKPGPSAPAGISKNALSVLRGNGLVPARRNPKLFPLRDGVIARTIGEQEVEALRHHDLIAPGLAGCQPSFLNFIAVEAMMSGTSSTTLRLPS